MSAQGDPVRSRQSMPFRTLRSSARGTPRGLFGNTSLARSFVALAEANRVPVSGEQHAQVAFGLLLSKLFAPLEGSSLPFWSRAAWSAF